MYRFIVQPSCDLHIGNLRIALLNFLCAKKENKRFIFRINDTNLNQDIKDSQALETFSAFGLSHDGAYYQSQNRKFYHQFAAKLLSESKAFSCFCTDKTLQAKQQKAVKNAQNYRYDGTCKKLSDDEVLNNESPFSIRLELAKKPIKLKDYFGKSYTFKPQELDNFNILERDKSPTTHFANAVDDMLQGISFIIQDNADIISSARAEFIHQNLGYEEKIPFLALGDIEHKEPLPTLNELLNQGFLPQAINNYLLTLNLNPPKEIFELQDASLWFDVSKLTCNSVKFNMERLGQINHEHIIRLEPTKLAALLGFSGEDFGKIAKLYAPIHPTLSQLKAILQAIFSPKSAPKGYENEFEILKNSMQNAPYFEEYEAYENHILNASKLKGEAFTKPFIALLLGNNDSIKPQELYPLIKNYLKEIIR